MRRAPFITTALVFGTTAFNSGCKSEQQSSLDVPPPDVEHTNPAPPEKDPIVLPPEKSEGAEGAEAEVAEEDEGAEAEAADEAKTTEPE